MRRRAGAGGRAIFAIIRAIFVFIFQPDLLAFMGPLPHREPPANDADQR